MLRIGIPPPAVKLALQREGKDPNIFDLDPNEPLSQQHFKAAAIKKPTKIVSIPKVIRKRLHWNKIDESRLHATSFWSQAKNNLASFQIKGLDVDNKEFALLFTSPIKKKSNVFAELNKGKPRTKKLARKQGVQLIDDRRRMNGSILLTMFKVNCKTLARQVDSIEHFEAGGNQLRALMALLFTKDEATALADTYLVRIPLSL
jgi:hypothetical protein